MFGEMAVDDSGSKAAKKLKEDLNNSSSIMEYGREVLRLLSSSDHLQQMRENAETVRIIKSKLDKSLERRANTISGMYEM